MSDKNPGRTAKVPLAQRIETTRKLLASRFSKADIKKTLMGLYGVSARTCESYLARAREEIRAETDKPIEDHRADAYAFYESILANPEGDPRLRLKAQERIDKLLGLEVHTRVASSKSIGLDLTLEQIANLSDEELNELIRRFEAAQGGAGGA